MINGDIKKRRYNTNPLDIYPLVGFINEGGLLNDSKGAINYLFKKKIPRNSKYVSTAHTFLKKTDRISYKYFIDGRPVEGLVQ